MLWLFYAVALLAYITLGSLEPDVLQHFLDTGEIDGIKIGPEVLLLFAIVFLVPLVMAFLSLTLKDSINRWANVIVGVVFAVIELVALSESVAQLSAWATLMELSKFVVAALIVWYAWKSKQKV